MLLQLSQNKFAEGEFHEDSYSVLKIPLTRCFVLISFVIDSLAQNLLHQLQSFKKKTELSLLFLNTRFNELQQCITL